MRRITVLLIGVVLLLTGLPTTFAQPTTTDTLQVEALLPNDGTREVDPNIALAVLFDRPVVAVRAPSDDDAGLPPGFVLSPTVPGEGQWLNSSTYVYRPTNGLAANTSYTMTVPAGLTSEDGASVPTAVTATFSTAPVSVVERAPAVNAASVPLDAPVSLTFSQPLDPASVPDALRLEDMTGNTVAGRARLSQDGRTLTFMPDALLRLDAVYRVVVAAAQARPAAGGSLAADVTWTFRTVPAPGVVSTQPGPGETLFPFYGNIALVFAGPMQAATVVERLSMTPAPPGGFDTFYSPQGNVLYINFQAAPSETYTVTLEPGALDAYGNPIATRFRQAFTTDAAPSELRFQVPGTISFTSASMPTTELFLARRNVGDITVELSRLPLDAVISAMTDTNAFYGLADALVPAEADLISRWTLPGSQGNTLDNALLDLAAQARAEAPLSCVASLPSRLRVGDVATVVSGPEAVRARATPPGGDILDLIYRGYRTTVVGGPTCANDLLWWEVELRDGRRAWVAESVDGEYLLGPALAAPDVTATPLPRVTTTGALPPGVYALSARARDMFGGEVVTRHVLVVGTANLTVKVGEVNTTVYATDAATGAPLVNVPVTVHQRGGVSTTATTTSSTADASNLAAGVALVALPDDAFATDLYSPRVAVLNSDGQFGLSSSTWDQEIQPFFFDQPLDTFVERYVLDLHTERPVYRPGDTVYARGIVLDTRPGSAALAYSAPSAGSVTFRLNDVTGNLVDERSVPLSDFGAAGAAFQLPITAQPGDYALNMIVDGSGVPGPSDSFREQSSTVYVTVAAYRLPAYQLDVMVEQPDLAAGTVARALVDASYFFEGGVGGATVDYRVRQQAYTFDYDGPGRYSFIDVDPAQPFGRFFADNIPVAFGRGLTDADGRAVLGVPTVLGANLASSTYSIEADVRDESGQVVSARTAFVAHQAPFYVGISLEGLVAEANVPTTLEAIAVDWDSVPVGGVAVTFQVFQDMQQTTSGAIAGSAFDTVQTTVTSTEVALFTATTADDGLAQVTFTPPSAGVYRVRASAVAPNNATVAGSANLYAAGEGQPVWGAVTPDIPRRTVIALERDEYAVGDAAQLLITSPFVGGAEVLVTVESRGVLWADQFAMTGSTTLYTLPVTDDFVPNVYVSVLLSSAARDGQVADFRYALTRLNVARDSRILTLDVQADTEQAAPGDEVRYTIRATDANGVPVQAELGVALVDLAALRLAPPNSLPIADVFYGLQALQTITGTSFTVNADLVTQFIREGGRLFEVGGRGGGGGGFGGPLTIREDLRATAYWDANLLTNADGVAQFTVTLQDNTTTWRLDARAVGQSTADDDASPILVGQASHDLVATKPLVVRPLAPRFFVVGDEVTLAAVVNNNTGAPLSVIVVPQVEGVMLQDANAQTVTVPTNGRARVAWRGVVNDVAGVSVVFSADGGTVQDAARADFSGDDGLLPVVRYLAPDTSATAGLLSAAGTTRETIVPPVNAGQASLSVTLQPSLAAAVLAGVRTFEADVTPLSNEAMASQLLARAALLDALQAQGAVRFPDVAALAQLDVQALIARQRFDGSWAWLEGGTTPDTLTTAYGLWALATARDLGVPVRDDALARAATYLEQQPAPDVVNAPASALNREALVVAALATNGVPSARADALYNARARLGLYGRGLLAIALQRANADDPRLTTLAADITGSAALSATGVSWLDDADVQNWGTSTRNSAVLTYALAQLQPQSTLLPNAVRGLLSLRRGDRWATTQEDAWAMLAVGAYARAVGDAAPAYAYSVTLDDDVLLEGVAAADNAATTRSVTPADGALTPGAPSVLTISRGDGPGVLAYSATLNVAVDAATVPPISRGVVVARRYTVGTGTTAVEQAAVGDVVIVRLTVVLPRAQAYLVVEDPLPAGLEALDPALAINPQSSGAFVDPFGPQAAPPSLFGPFVRAAFGDQRVTLFSENLPTGTYEVTYMARAVTPGVFTVLPPSAYAFYAPDVFGRGAGGTFTVTEAAAR